MQSEDEQPQPVKPSFTTASMRRKMAGKNKQKKVQSVDDNSNLAPANKLKGKGIYVEKQSRANEFIEQIELDVANQVEKEWDRKRDIAKEQQQMEEEIR